MNGGSRCTAAAASRRTSESVQHLAEQQHGMLDHLMAAQPQTSQQLWQSVMQAMWTTSTGATTVVGCKTPGNPAILIPKMTVNNDPEAFLNLFEHLVQVASWLENQWAAILMPCLAGPS